MITEMGEGYFADVEVDGFALRLVCVETGAGIAVNVFSYKDDRWNDSPAYVHDLDEGKQLATNKAQQLLTAINPKLRLQNIDWKKS